MVRPTNSNHSFINSGINMTSITTYTPFTYCITFIPTGQRYYGSRYANNKKEMAHPSQLWTTYFTSSKIIFDLIEEHGKDAFIFEVRKTFITAEQARSWETKFLTRIDAAKHPEWLNGHNGGKNFHSTPESVQKWHISNIKTSEEKLETKNKKTISWAARTPEQEHDRKNKERHTKTSKTLEQKNITKQKTKSTKDARTSEQKLASRLKHKASRAARTPEQERDRISKCNATRNAKTFEEKEKLRQATSKKSKKDYIITYPSGDQIQINGLTEFCKNNLLSYSAMSGIARGSRKYYNGWNCEKVNFTST